MPLSTGASVGGDSNPMRCSPPTASMREGSNLCRLPQPIARLRHQRQWQPHQSAWIFFFTFPLRVHLLIFVEGEKIRAFWFGLSFSLFYLKIFVNLETHFFGQLCFWFVLLLIFFIIKVGVLPLSSNTTK